MTSGVITVITLGIMLAACLIIRIISCNGIIPYAALTFFQQKCVVTLLVVNIVSALIFTWFFIDYMNKTDFIEDLILRMKLKQLEKVILMLGFKSLVVILLCCGIIDFISHSGSIPYTELPKYQQLVVIVLCFFNTVAAVFLAKYLSERFDLNDLIRSLLPK